MTGGGHRAGQALAKQIGVIPYLPDAGCRTPDGFVAMTEYLDGVRGMSPAMTEDARKVCQKLCPATTRAACLAWVMTEEIAVGGWGGMYAGLTAGDRMKQWGSLSLRERVYLARRAVIDAERATAAARA